MYISHFTLETIWKMTSISTQQRSCTWGKKIEWSYELSRYFLLSTWLQLWCSTWYKMLLVTGKMFTILWVKQITYFGEMFSETLLLYSLWWSIKLWGHKLCQKAYLFFVAMRPQWLPIHHIKTNKTKNLWPRCCSFRERHFKLNVNVCLLTRSIWQR